MTVKISHKMWGKRKEIKMSRKEMIRFLSKNGIKASVKDSTARLERKFDKYRCSVERKRYERDERKLVKRAQRRLQKTGRLSNRLKRVMANISSSDIAA